MKFLMTLICFIIVVLVPIESHAYIDPSGATYLLQILVGTFIAIGTVIGIFFHKIKRFFKKKKNKDIDEME